MKETLLNIKNLIPALLDNDKSLGYEFLEKRDFESLLELLESDIFLIKKSLKKEIQSKEYLNDKLENLYKLKAEIDLYCAHIQVPESTESYFDEDFYDARTEY